MRVFSSRNFRQDLTSNLHFRQCKLPTFRNRVQLEGGISKLLQNSRQAYASNGGKEILQVTLQFKNSGTANSTITLQLLEILNPF